MRVYDGNKLLKEGIDYSLKYRNNKNACIDISEKNKDKAPTVTFIGKGAYKNIQKREKRFKISPVDISDVTVANSTVAFTKNKVNKPAPTVIIKGKGNYKKSIAIQFDIPEQ